MAFYPKIPHSHVVPAGYLRAWATGRQIRAHRREEPQGKLIGYRDAAVRKDFYRRERPATGEVTYDIEWTLQQLENRAIPILNAVRRGEWPLDSESKLGLAQLWAIQLLRGPAFKDWHHTFVGVNADRLEREGALEGDAERTSEELGDELRSALRSNTERLTRMLNLGITVAEILAAMSWTLVSFAKPCLLTSDEPITVWPISRGSSSPQRNNPDAGLLDTLEVFLPISPEMLLLMTWQLTDSPARLVGWGRHAATANAFAIENADAAWFTHPDYGAFKPGRGPREPLSAGLAAGYDQPAALYSPLRQAVRDHANRQVGRKRLVRRSSRSSP